ncbi:MAG: hypothetical protein HY560_12940 [Gemmatimonadetes bacterium]|nr:hypothetical protein [Gemmatimonadota bacterium]
MPLPQESLEEMAVRRYAAEELAGRDRRRAWVRAALLCWFWSLMGLYGLGWAMHTTNMTYAMVAFWAGLAIGNGGILFTLISAWRQAERRGDHGPPA